MMADSADILPYGAWWTPPGARCTRTDACSCMLHWWQGDEHGDGKGAAVVATTRRSSTTAALLLFYLIFDALEVTSIEVAQMGTHVYVLTVVPAFVGLNIVNSTQIFVILGE